MNFTSEDGILTAEEARERSEAAANSVAGTEHDRKTIRSLMSLVKTNSFYGSRFGYIDGQYRPTDNLLNELNKLGYKLEYYQNREDHRICNYTYTISW